MTILVPGQKNGHNKYRNKPQRYNGIFFPSKKELKRWIFLETLRDRGEISDLRRQVPYRFHISGKLMFTYRADFVYLRNGEEIIEDAKGVITPLYAMKKKILEAHYGFRIIEV